MTLPNFSKERKALKKVYLTKLRQLDLPKKTIDEIASKYKSYSLFQLVARINVLDTHYLNVDPIKSDPRYKTGDPDLVKNHFNSINITREAIYNRILTNPFSVEAIKMLDTINGILKGAIATNESTAYTIESILQAQNDYVADCVKQMKNYDRKSSTSVENDMAKDIVTIHQPSWPGLKLMQHSRPDYRDYEYRQAIESLFPLLADPKLPEETFLYFFNQGPSSSGCAEVEDTHFKVLLPIFSASMQKDIYQEVNALRRSKIAEPDDEDLDFTYQENLEKDFVKQESTDMFSHASHAPTGASTPNWQSFFGSGFGMPPQQGSPGPSGQQQQQQQQGPSTGPDTKGPDQGPDPSDPSGQPPSGQGPPPPPPPPPQVPDDSNYDPMKDSPMLFVLAKEWTKLALAAPPNARVHDHMDRFNSTSEGPQTLSSTGSQQGDWFIISMEPTGQKKYVVTFTRKSRKPIFNPVY